MPRVASDLGISLVPEPNRSIRRASLAMLAVAMILSLLNSATRAALSAHEYVVSTSAAASAIKRGDLVRARNQLSAAQDSASSLQALLGDPLLRVVGQLPAIETEFQVANELTRSLVRLTRVGSHFLNTISRPSERGWRDVLYDHGRVDLVGLKRIAKGTAALQAELASIRSELDDLPAPFSDLLQHAVTAARSKVNKAHEMTRKASLMLSALPSLLGANGPRSYLIAFQTPTEARGAGGMIGFLGVFSAHRGALELTQLAPARRFTRLVRGSIDAPRWFLRLYGRSAVRDIRQVNQSPNFPVTSKLLLNLYERAVEKDLDGVIAVDPIALGTLTKATGPIRSYTWNEQLTPMMLAGC